MGKLLVANMRPVCTVYRLDSKILVDVFWLQLPIPIQPMQCNIRGITEFLLNILNSFLSCHYILRPI